MRILIIIHQFLPRHAAGSENYTYYLAKELQQRGHDVHLYFTEMHAGRPHAELRTGVYDDLPFHEAVNNHSFQTFRHTYRDLAMEANLRVVLDAVAPDVVHIQHLHLHSIGYVGVLKERGLRVVYTLHEYITMCLRNGWLLRDNMALCEGPELDECAKCARIFPPPGRLDGEVDLDMAPSGDPWRDAIVLRRHEVQSAFDQVDLFLSPSRFLRQKFIDAGMIDPERIRFSDNGFAVKRFRRVARVPSDAVRFGYFGQLGEWKGVHLLVEAFNAIEEVGVECKIYGDPTAFPEYARSLREKRLNHAVRFMGRFDNKKVAEVLAGIDVLVVPSLWFENSPLTIHEAFLGGLPVICSDRGGMAELVEDGVSGLHFRMGDALDLRAKILRVLREPGLLESLKKSFPEVKDIETDAEMMERRYEALLAGEPVAC